MKLSKIYFVAFFASFGLLACSDDREAGGVTDIGNSIAGNVYLADGTTPAVGARVVVYDDAWEYAEIADSVETIADAAGHFEFENVPQNMHFLFAVNGNENYLQNGVADGAKLVLSPSKSLTGSVFAENAGKVRIVGTYLEAALDSNGRFSFAEIPSGNISLVYVKDGVSQAHYEFTTADMAAIQLPNLRFDGGAAMDSITVSIEDSSAETLRDFVLPVKFNDKIDFAKFSDPEKYKVVSAKGKELSFEVDYWTAEKAQGVLWVRLDSLPAKRNEIKLYVIERDEAQVPAGAFRESDAVMASLHMNGDAKIVAATDSDAAYGVIGYGTTLSKGQYISLDSINPLSGDFTLSTWVNWNGDNGNHQTLFAKRASWADSTLFQWYYETNTKTFAVIEGKNLALLSLASALKVGEWNLLSLVSENDTLSMYVNGKRVGLPVSFKLRDEAMKVPFRVGGNDVPDETWNGSLDEVYVITEARSAEWLRLEYETQWMAKN